ncbi:uncharacterized protein LOC129746927 [Uranotaenia lowii]|uniref:uncharacterized protein LOC129746927 n=1 Tax=Uranotaenia lowii TaxID=190385 RepID=UPI00247AE999|nr:uncharacterized protein LOC129746927 [Uranotaenia lowii]
MNESRPRYCIVGGGVGGVVCARHVAATGGQVVVYEQMARTGGTWVYSDEVGLDRDGIEVHTSLYEGLRANFPKDVMGFPDWDIKSDISFVGPEKILEWLDEYIEHFELDKLIKYRHQVVRVTPIHFKKGKWEVIVRNLADNKYETLEFDYILVCNGHYACPVTPEYDGQDLYQGIQIHSHDYRNSDILKGRDVLIVGAGFSAVDVTTAAVKVAKSVTVSHHKPDSIIFKDALNVAARPAIASHTPKGVKFVDGSEIECSIIVYCTGYKYTFPFLSVDCGITLDDKHVQPLYKHIFNMNHTTMALIGVPFYCCPAQMMDLQVRFVLAYWTGRKSLPSRQEMLADTEKDIAERRSRGIPKKCMHKMMDDFQARYYEDLATTADLKPIKPVVIKLFDQCVDRLREDCLGYKDDFYEVLNDEEFVLHRTKR